MRIIHWVIFFRTTGCPPRSETPLTISSFARTVPKAGHQFTSASAKYVNRYFNSIRCFSSFESCFHSSAEKLGVSSSQTALTFVLPSVSNRDIKVAMGMALSASVSYHELKSCMNIHCVHL